MCTPDGKVYQMATAPDRSRPGNAGGGMALICLIIGVISMSVGLVWLILIIKEFCD